MSRNPYIKTDPKKWSEEEIQLLKELRKTKTIKECAIILERSEVSVSIKWKRVNKKENTYNLKHIKEKYKFNRMFINDIQPKNILDAYAGKEGSWYLREYGYDEFIVEDNDIELNSNTKYVSSSQEFLYSQFIDYGKNSYDIVDLDPFGSAYECFIPAIQLAKKGLVITFGEMGHKRWRRLDFVSKAYNIENFEDFTIENIIKQVQKLGRLYKKELTPKYIMNGVNINRVYFEISIYKETSQWN